MRIVYIADDGTEFSNRKRCAEYEEQMDLTHVKMLDGNKEPTNAVQDVFYVYFATERDYGAFFRNCDQFGVACPDRYELGCWMYDDYDCEWRTFAEVEEQKRQELQQLEEIRRMLTEESA